MSVMDKIKSCFIKIQKHHFWILIGISIAVLLYCWNLSVNEMEQQFKKNKRAVDMQFTDLKTKSQRPIFPNEQWIEGTRNITSKMVDNSNRAWQKVMHLQDPALQWPVDPEDEENSKAFAQEARKSRWDPELEEDLVEFYAEHAPKQIQGLRDTVAAILVSKNEDIDAPVVWNEEDYLHLERAYNPEGIKKKSDCKIRQKVFWVLQALIMAIKETNQSGDDPTDPPIHHIKELAAARQAKLVEADWQIEGFSENAPRAPSEAKKRAVKKSSSKARPGKPSRSPTANKKPSTSLLTNIANPKEVDGYDLIAFRMRVRMDVKYLDRLLTACANSTLPLTIQGLRFHRNQQLTVVATAEPKKTPQNRGAARRFSRSTKKPAAEEKVGEEGVKKFERGTLVEIWGYAYLAVDKNISEPPKGS